ncbi:MAG: hypothetical protein A49_23840 [Methyloceanibacter sp.]|nr:MAG: hypothetical protein A49_23840 [Methyloceanibacter sp.]
MPLTSEQWYRRDPKSVGEIEADLRTGYPNLHLYLTDGADAEVRGTFPVRSSAGRELDAYQIAIRLPPNFPRTLPEVRETRGRIPWHADYHVNADGTCCVLLPEDRGRCFPEGAPFKRYLDGPLHNFFLGQSLVALGERWPFGEWGHGKEGVCQFYRDLFKTDDPGTIVRFLEVLTKRNAKPQWQCPCGSGKKIRKCCESKITEFRRLVPPAIARKSAEQLGLRSAPVASQAREE